MLKCCNREQKAQNDKIQKTPKAEREMVHLCPSKLSKRELEDLYFTLLQKNMELKKTTNSQSEKIKLLSTKLNRMTAAQHQKHALGQDKVSNTSSNIINEQKQKIFDLQKANDRLKDRIQQLNTRLCSAKQFLSGGPFQTAFRAGYTSARPASLKNASMSALETKNNDGPAKTTSVSCQCLDKELESTKNIGSGTNDSENPNEFDDNRTKTLMEELKQQVADLQQELFKTHEEYSTRITDLEKKVTDLQTENLRVRSEHANSQLLLEQKEQEANGITSRLRDAEVQCGDLAARLSIEKAKVAELEMRVKAAHLSTQVAKAIEEHCSGKGVDACGCQKEVSKRRLLNDVPTTDPITISPGKLLVHETSEVQDGKKSDDSGYTDIRSPNPKDDQEKRLNRINSELIIKIAALQSELDALKISAIDRSDKSSPTSPDGRARSIARAGVESDSDKNEIKNLNEANNPHWQGYTKDDYEKYLDKFPENVDDPTDPKQQMEPQQIKSDLDREKELKKTADGHNKYQIPGPIPVASRRKSVASTTSRTDKRRKSNASLNSRSSPRSKPLVNLNLDNSQHKRAVLDSFKYGQRQSIKSDVIQVDSLLRTTSPGDNKKVLKEDLKRGSRALSINEIIDSVKGHQKVDDINMVKNYTTEEIEDLGDKKTSGLNPTSSLISSSSVRRSSTTDTRARDKVPVNLYAANEGQTKSEVKTESREEKAKPLLKKMRAENESEVPRESSCEDKKLLGEKYELPIETLSPLMENAKRVGGESELPVDFYAPSEDRTKFDSRNEPSMETLTPLVEITKKIEGKNEFTVDFYDPSEDRTKFDTINEPSSTLLTDKFEEVEIKNEYPATNIKNEYKFNAPKELSVETSIHLMEKLDRVEAEGRFPTCLYAPSEDQTRYDTRTKTPVGTLLSSPLMENAKIVKAEYEVPVDLNALNEDLTSFIAENESPIGTSSPLMEKTKRVGARNGVQVNSNASSEDRTKFDAKNEPLAGITTTMKEKKLQGNQLGMHTYQEQPQTNQLLDQLFINQVSPDQIPLAGHDQPSDASDQNYLTQPLKKEVLPEQHPQSDQQTQASFSTFPQYGKTSTTSIQLTQNQPTEKFDQASQSAASIQTDRIINPQFGGSRGQKDQAPQTERTFKARQSVGWSNLNTRKNSGTYTQGHYQHPFKKPDQFIKNWPPNNSRRDSAKTYTVQGSAEVRRSTSPENTDCEISTMSDLPLEKECHRGGQYREPLSPGEDKATTTYTDSYTMPSTTDYGSLSEGELPGEQRGKRSSWAKEIGNDATNAQIPAAGNKSEKMEAALNAISQELARCRRLLMNQTPEPKRQYRDAEAMAEIVPTPSLIALRKSEGKSSIGDAFTPKCIFTLHIGTAMFADEAVISSRDTSLVLSWQFFDQTVTMTRMRPGRVVRFDFSTEYEVKLNDDLLKYMKHEEMQIVMCELHKQDRPFFRCALPLRNPLLHTNKRVHMSLALVTGPGMVRRPSGSNEMGVLDLWCMLSVEPKLLPRVNKTIAMKDEGSGSGVPPSANLDSIMTQINEDDRNRFLLADLDLPAGKRAKKPPFLESENEAERDIRSSFDRTQISSSHPAPPGPRLARHEIEPLMAPMATYNPYTERSQVSFDSKFSPAMGRQSSGVIINEVPANITSPKEMKRALEKPFGVYTEPRWRQMDSADNPSPHASVLSIKSLVGRRRSQKYKQRLSLAQMSTTNSVNELLNNRPRARESTNKPQEGFRDVEKYNQISKRSLKNDEGYDRNEYLRRTSNQAVDVTVIWLALNEECDAMLDPNVQRLYVAYSFLGRNGAELETPFSVPKPKQFVEKCYFNFKKIFQLSESDMLILGRMARNRTPSKSRPNVKDCVVFTVVSEPVEDPLGLNNCEDIGYAYLYFGDLLAYSVGNDSYTEAIPVYAVRAEGVVCGVLAIKVDGLDVVRKCLILTQADSYLPGNSICIMQKLLD